MWIGIGKLIQWGTRVRYQNLSMEQQSANDGHCYKMDKSGQLHARSSKDYEVHQLLCGQGVPCEDVGLEKGSFLKPYLADYNYIS